MLMKETMRRSVEKYVTNPVKVVVGTRREAVRLGSLLMVGEFIIAAGIIAYKSDVVLGGQRWLIPFVSIGLGAIPNLGAIRDVSHRIKVARTSSKTR